MTKNDLKRIIREEYAKVKRMRLREFDAKDSFKGPELDYWESLTDEDPFLKMQKFFTKYPEAKSKVFKSTMEENFIRRIVREEYRKLRNRI